MATSRFEASPLIFRLFMCEEESGTIQNKITLCSLLHSCSEWENHYKYENSNSHILDVRIATTIIIISLTYQYVANHVVAVLSITKRAREDNQNHCCQKQSM